MLAEFSYLQVVGCTRGNVTHVAGSLVGVCLWRGPLLSSPLVCERGVLRASPLERTAESLGTSLVVPHSDFCEGLPGPVSQTCMDGS